MILDYEKSELTRVSDIKIPDVFFRRMRTKSAVLDRLFGGEGILPGMAFTIAAGAGTGKTTLMLQACEALSKQGYNAGYISGEESSVMLAYTCKRLKLTELRVCHETNIDHICEMMKDLDFVVIDSFASLVDSDGHRPKHADAISKIVSAAKETECAVGVILHFTKAGNYKGSTDIPHAVDCNIMLEVDKDADNLRHIFTTKNRYGCVFDGNLTFGHNGYDLDKMAESEYKTEKATGKKNKMDLILTLKEPPHITVARVVKELGVADAYARQMLYKLSASGKLVKFGSGESAVWKFPQPAENKAAAIK